MEQRPPFPPFTLETALQKVQSAEDAWNTRDPEKVALAYTLHTEWRNRTEFLNGRDAITAFLHRKWTKELDYDTQGQWYRSYGNELWEFDDNGLMRKRYASINDMPIEENDRKL